MNTSEVKFEKGVIPLWDAHGITLTAAGFCVIV